MLKDEVRRKRAMQLLLRTGRPIKQVTEAAGFQNPESVTSNYLGGIPA